MIKVSQTLWITCYCCCISLLSFPLHICSYQGANVSLFNLCTKPFVHSPDGESSRLSKGIPCSWAPRSESPLSVGIHPPSTERSHSPVFLTQFHNLFLFFFLYFYFITSFSKPHQPLITLFFIYWSKSCYIHIQICYIWCHDWQSWPSVALLIWLPAYRWLCKTLNPKTPLKLRGSYWTTLRQIILLHSVIHSMILSFYESMICWVLGFGQHTAVCS